jgi:hypothetical protein
MPALVAGIHALIFFQVKGVDGRDKPGHDDAMSHRQTPLVCLSLAPLAVVGSFAS